MVHQLFVIFAVALLSSSIFSVDATTQPNKKNKWEAQVKHARTNKAICQGSIVRKDVIVVPRRHVENLNPDDLIILVGSVTLGAGASYRCRQIERHPKWNGDHNNDVALLFLYAAINLDSDTTVIALPTPGATLPSGSQVFVSSWGVGLAGLLGFLISLVVSLLGEVVEVVLGGEGACPLGALCAITSLAGGGASLAGDFGGIVTLVGQLVVPSSGAGLTAIFTSFLDLSNIDFISTCLQTIPGL